MGAEVSSTTLLRPFDLEPNSLAGKKITIMGLGRFGGGSGAARFFAQHGAQVVVTDLAQPQTLTESVQGLADLPNITFHLGAHRDEDFTSADAVVVNPAVPLDSPFLVLANRAGVLLTAEMNILFRLCPAQIVGVTGSNGKSTVTAMIGSVFSAAQKAQQGNFRRVFVGGNIGHSLLAELDRISSGDVVVVELSSFQLEALTAEGISPHVAVWTNFSANHLDHHGTIDAYREAKRNIFRFQLPQDVLVYNADDVGLEFLRSDAAVCSRRVIFSLQDSSADAHTADGCLALRYPPGNRVEKLLDLKDMPVPGRHNIANALAAACVGAQFNLSGAAITEGLRTFRPLPHRLELVATVAGVSYYDDSVATTPESALVGLNSFDCPPIIILGGKDKGAEFDILLRACIDKCYGVICLGQIRDKLLQQLLNLRGRKRRPHIIGVDSLEQAVAAAASLAKRGQAVLLSPACSSYDMFTNFTDRGQRFAEIVRALPSAK
ncbi:MAG: UDP-N-acetylmuramoyl-L-alanine--D-glutamate ligase [Actinobacteria bacterium]|nr:UDP-N-acetylmuramoyl-L-alanine--D-glutamate ligase [Actinomycetota bacterium]